MRNIRYLLAQNNIRPDGEQKRKMAEALLSGKRKNGKKLYRRDGFLSAARVFAVILLSFAVITAILFGISALIKSEDRKDGETTRADTAAQDTDTAAVHIDDKDEMVFFNQIYVNDKTHNILRMALDCSYTEYSRKTENGGYPVRSIFVSDPALGLHKPLIEAFSADEEDLDDIIMSLYAYSSSPAITGRYGAARSVEGGKPYTAILASYTENTFEYVITANISIKDDKIYICDGGEWVECGSVSYYSYSENYSPLGGRAPQELSIRRDLLKTLTLYKIRVEGGLPVIYDCQEIRLGGAYKLITSSAYVYKADGNYGYDFNNISSSDNRKIFLPKEYSPAAVSDHSAYYNIVHGYHFASPSPEMRSDACNIINELNCEWFFPVRKSGNVYIGVPVYYNKSLKGFTDVSGNRLNAYFDPYDSVVPELYLDNVSIPFVHVLMKDGDAQILEIFHVDDLNPLFIEYFEKFGEPPLNKYVYPRITERLNQGGFISSLDYYSPDALERCVRYGFTDTGSVSEKNVRNTCSRLENELGVKFDGQIKTFEYNVMTNSSAIMQDLYGRSDITAYGSAVFSLNLQFISFELTGYSDVSYIKSSEKTYSVRELYGYTVLTNGLIADFQGRIIGFMSGVLYDDTGGIRTDIVSLCKEEELPPLYMICDGDTVVYIGTVMPSSHVSGKTVFPFEMLNYTLLYSGEIAEYFGPFCVIKDTVTDVNLHTQLTVENPEFAAFSYLHYENGNYKRIFSGKHGDKFIRNPGNTVYTLELAGNTRPVIGKNVYIHILWYDVNVILY